MQMFQLPLGRLDFLRYNNVMNIAELFGILE